MASLFLTEYQHLLSQQTIESFHHSNDPVQVPLHPPTPLLSTTRRLSSLDSHPQCFRGILSFDNLLHDSSQPILPETIQHLRRTTLENHKSFFTHRLPFLLKHSSRSPLSSSSHLELFLSFSPDEIAQQSCLAFHSFFHQIPFQELLGFRAAVSSSSSDRSPMLTHVNVNPESLLLSSSSIYRQYKEFKLNVSPFDAPLPPSLLLPSLPLSVPLLSLLLCWAR
jgi:hypothetical protein